MLLRFQHLTGWGLAMWVPKDYAMGIQSPRVAFGPTCRHDTMMTPAPVCLRPTLEELLPVFRSCFSRATLRQLLQQTAPTSTFYWRLFTPLIVLWCLIVQRLQADHTTDAIISHLHSRAADALDLDDPHRQALSRRLISENSCAY